MPNRSHTYSDTFTEKQFSSIIADWAEAMRQLQRWYKLLDEAIADNSNPENARGDRAKKSVSELIKLRTKIDCGLIRLTKEVNPEKNTVNIPLELLQLVEHTETVLHWCIEVKQRLGVNSGTEYNWISAN